MDYRRPLFQLEQWSPFLAKKIWGLTSFFENPLTLALGLRVRHLTDKDVEIEVPLGMLSKAENGQIRKTILIATGEFASKILWQRHLDPAAEEMNLFSVHCRFMKPGTTTVRVRSELLEAERERVLRKIRSGESADFEMPITFMDERDQQIASMNCVWNIKAVGQNLLGEGRSR